MRTYEQNACILTRICTHSNTGPIVVTSSCLTQPLGAYKSNMYTFGPVGWSNINHLGDDLTNINWAQVLAKAQTLPGFTEANLDSGFGFDRCSERGQPSPGMPLVVGYGHDALLGAADVLIDVS
jgi:hydroxylamine reductase